MRKQLLLIGLALLPHLAAAQSGTEEFADNLSHVVAVVGSVLALGLLPGYVAAMQLAASSTRRAISLAVWNLFLAAAWGILTFGCFWLLINSALQNQVGMSQDAYIYGPKPGWYPRVVFWLWADVVVAALATAWAWYSWHLRWLAAKASPD